MIKRICNKIFFYPDGLGEFLSETRLLDVAIKDALKVFEKETWIVMSPNTVLDNLLERLEQYVDWISTSLGCDCSDFIDNSQAVDKMKKITQGQCKY